MGESHLSGCDSIAPVCPSSSSHSLKSLGVFRALNPWGWGVGSSSHHGSWTDPAETKPTENLAARSAQGPPAPLSWAQKQLLVHASLRKPAAPGVNMPAIA